MTKDEALHKALKVLNCLNNDRVYETAWVKGAINACKEALEQPARLVSYAPDKSTCTLNIDGEEVYFNQEQPAQEPVAWMTKWENQDGEIKYAVYEEKIGKFDIPLYTHPAPSWQGLSDDEIEKIYADTEPDSKLDTYYIVLSRAIEAKLKEKNYVSNT